jgi:hypothetical protein
MQTINKIERLRAAIGAARDPDLSKIKAKVFREEGRVRFQHDFSAGMAKAQVENQLWTVVRSIADLADHLRKWAAANHHHWKPAECPPM